MRSLICLNFGKSIYFEFFHEHFLNSEITKMSY